MPPGRQGKTRNQKIPQDTEVYVTTKHMQSISLEMIYKKL